MAPEYHYVTHVDGVDTALTNIRFGSIAVSESGEMGAPQTSGIWLDDDNGSRDFIGNQGFYIKETAAPAQAALTGTVTKASGSTTIVGAGTSFLSQVVAGRELVVPGGGGTDYLFVQTVTDNTHITVWQAPKYAASGQSAVLAAQQVVFYSYTGIQNIGRAVASENGGGYVLAAGRRWNIDLSDVNTILHRKIERLAGANRPAESAAARLTWMLGSSVVAGLLFDEGLVSYPHTHLDKADLRGRFVDEILNSLAQSTGYNFAVYYHEYTGHFCLYFRKDISWGYPSSVRLSNVQSEIVAGTHRPFFMDGQLQRDPRRVIDGVRVTGGFKGSVYRTRAATGTVFDHRDANAPNSDIHRTDTAALYGDRLLADNSTQAERLKLTMIVSQANVNDIKILQAVRAHAQHVPGWSTERWGRVVQRDDKQTKPRIYEQTIELVPCNGPFDCSTASDLNALYGTDTAFVQVDSGGTLWAWATLPNWFGGPPDHAVSEIPVYTPANANDGNNATFSYCPQETLRNVGSVSLVWKADLGANYSVCGFKGTNGVGSDSWRSYPPTKIQYSTDGVTWIDCDGSLTYTPSTPSPQFWEFGMIASVTGRYFRMLYTTVDTTTSFAGLWGWNPLGTRVYTWKIMGDPTPV